MTRAFPFSLCRGCRPRSQAGLVRVPAARPSPRTSPPDPLPWPLRTGLCRPAQAPNPPQNQRVSGPPRWLSLGPGTCDLVLELELACSRSNQYNVRQFNVMRCNLTPQANRPEAPREAQGCINSCKGISPVKRPTERAETPLPPLSRSYIWLWHERQ